MAKHGVDALLRSVFAGEVPEYSNTCMTSMSRGEHGRKQTVEIEIDAATLAQPGVDAAVSQFEEASYELAKILKRYHPEE